MLIYKQEKHLEDKILRSRSVSYASQVEKAVAPEEILFSKAARINQETPQTQDLYYTRSVYVSTNWNLNADVFLPQEVWSARYTPVDKPSNIGHDQNKIVGHIVSTWAIDQNGNVIDGNTPFDDVPKFFHLANGGVIYSRWQDEELQKEVDALIHRIEDGKEFVSMEALFSNFDYALRNSDDDEDIKIIKRSEDTSFLTSRLKIFGGSGEYDGHQVGRVLRNITYSGKGYVKNPGNPFSVIFSNDKISKFSFANVNLPEKTGVYIEDKEKTNMSDTNKELVEQLKADLEATKAELSASKAEQDKLQKEFADKTAKEFQDAKASLETEISSLQEKLDEEQKAKACMCGQHDELKAEHEKLKKEYEDLMDISKSAKRIQALKDKGFSEDDAKAKLDELSELSDDNFNVIMSMIPAQASPGGGKPDCDDKKYKDDFRCKSESDDESEAEADEVDESVAPEGDAAKASLNTAEVKPEEELMKTQAALASHFSGLFGNDEKETK